MSFNPPSPIIQGTTSLLIGAYGSSDAVSIMSRIRNQDIGVTQQRWIRASGSLAMYCGATSYMQMQGSGGFVFNAQTNAQNGYSFNIVNSKCNAISGREVKNRKSMTCIANSPAYDRIATAYTKMLSYADNRSGLSSKFSRGFQHGMITGLAIGELFLNRTKDFVNGEIDIAINEYNAIIYDYTCRDIINFTDCKYVWLLKYLDKHVAMKYYPEAADKIANMSTASYSNSIFSFMPEAQTNRQLGTVAVSRFWHQVPYNKNVYISTEPSPIQGKSFEEGQLPEDILNDPRLKFQVVTIPSTRWRLSIVVNEVLVQEYDNYLGIDDCPLISFIWDYNPENPVPQFRVRGYPDAMFSQQMLVNHAILKNHNILESSINSGLQFEEDQLVDEDMASRTGEALNIVRKQGSPEVGQLSPVTIPQSNFMLIDYLMQSAEMASSVKPIVDGSDKGSTSGIMDMLRQDASDEPLQKYWANTDETRHRMAMLESKIISANWSAAKVAEILNVPDYKTCEEFLRIEPTDYRFVIEDAAYSTAQKRNQFVTTSEICAMLGVKLPIDLGLRLAPITGVEELIEALQKEQESTREAESQKLALELALVEAEIKKLNAQALEQMNLAKSHNARAGSYEGLEHERNAEVAKNESTANKNNTESLLKLVPLIERYGIDKVKELILLLNEDNSSASNLDEIEKLYGQNRPSVQAPLGSQGDNPPGSLQEQTGNQQIYGPRADVP